MLLNNNWSVNTETKKWKSLTEGLVKTDFDSLKQDVKSYRFYQKCLSGSTYVAANSEISGSTNNADISNIYEILNKETEALSWVWGGALSYLQAFTGSLPPNSVTIGSTESVSTLIDKVLPDYNFTLKNLFTPERLIEDQKKNIFYVDLATTTSITNINDALVGLKIDDFFVREGQRILVKDQFTEVVLSSSVNPDNYFFGYYEISESIGTSVTYRIPSQENGIYIYLNRKLVRTNDLSSYEKLLNYSVGVKLGTVNKEKEFKLERLKSGFYPDYKTGLTSPAGGTGESTHFIESHNFVIRQRVDYNNLFELSLNSTLKHPTQSIVIELNTTTQSGTVSYTIPQRTLTVGEFGSIINHQEGITNFINSKYKKTLRSLTETIRYYWICGDEGLLLRVDKTNFDIINIDLNLDQNSQLPFDRVLTKLNSIDFFNDLRGVLVGDFNQIWVTSDSGKNWNQIYIPDFEGFNFNSVVFGSVDKFYVGGDNGVFIEFSFSLGNWSAFKRRVSKWPSGFDDEFELVDNINSLHYFENSGNRYLAIASEFSKIYLYDLDRNLSNDWDFVYLQDNSTTENSFGDISSVTWASATSSLFFSTFESIWRVDPFNGTFSSTNSNILSLTFSQFLTQSGINDIFTFDNSLIYTGNFTLWKESFLSTTTSNVYDSDFLNRLKPGLLFLDYDIGSKLYWFDDFSQYRIPNRYGLTLSLIQNSSGTNSSIGFNQNTNTLFNQNTGSYITYSETNWITYFKDRQKTFKFYGDDSLKDINKVEPSFTFSSSDAVGKTFSYLTSSVTTNYSDIVGLMPIAVPRGEAPSLTQSSRFRNSAGIPISLPSIPKSLYFYDYLGIWQEEFLLNDIIPSVGDVLYIDSDVFEGDFIINRIEAGSYSVTPGSRAQSNIPLRGTISSSAIFSLSVDGLYLAPTMSVFGASYSSTLDFLNSISLIINSGTHGYTSSTIISTYPTLKIESPIGSIYNGLIPNFYLSPSLFRFPATPFIGGSDTVFGSASHFMYFYTDFNENILNNIPNSKTGFTIRDLNKYPLTTTSNSAEYFIDNFNKHYIGYSYDCEFQTENTQSVIITPKYSQWSAYYNLQTKVDLNDVSSNSYSDEIKYTSGFLNFGYSPTYNLLSYLNFLNPSEYLPTKEFLSMPNWVSIPGPDNISFTTQSSIFIDVGLKTNKLRLGVDLKYIWDSLLKWTFVDININHTTPATVTTERLLILDKYLDLNEGFYIIEFHDEINFNLSTNIDTIDILSRRTLKQISDDLQYINRLQRPNWKISDSYDSTLSAVLGTYSNYETEINFKVPTDSYCKILLLDAGIVDSLSGLVYTDYKYELAMQVAKLDVETELEVSSISASGSNYQFNFDLEHGLKNNDWIIVNLTSTQSVFPTSLLGYHNIQVSGTGSIVLPITTSVLLGTPNLTIFRTKKDYFLNYQPIDIFDIGISDKKITQSVEINLNNWDIVGQSYNLLDLDLTKYKFRLIDGLDLVQLNKNFGWILEAEITDATIGLDLNKNLVWYKGIWQCGRWFGGKWISGTWLSGDWYSGDWTSKPIEDKILQIKVGNNNSTSVNSYWFGGRWFSGNWENGSWLDGRWYSGTWSNGIWYDGTWNDGTWKSGEFKSGIWVLGDWETGLFNQTNGHSFWLDGKFKGGDFENGEWYNGTFDEIFSESRFGTKASNSRPAIWRAGKFINGEFHSFLNLDDNGLPTVSDVHKYSEWRTGLFSGGDFYGGIAYNISFKNTIWHGGILEDIELISVSASNNSFVLSGEWDWNINDEFYIVDNMITSSFSSYGSTTIPIKYKVLKTVYDPDNETTTVNTNVNLSNIGTISGTTSNLRIVSSFENSTWLSGIWRNGVFSDGNFQGGIWYNGNFSGDWG